MKTLRITYVGMEPLEVAVSTKTLRIQLRNDVHTLDEVVVVAYGTQKKTSLTGSIQEVKSEAIELRPTSSVASALEGSVTGVLFVAWEPSMVLRHHSIFLMACLIAVASAT